MQMVPVESSNVAAIGYAPEVCLMRVRFLDGSEYDYPGISESTHALVMASPSKGSALTHLDGVRISPPTGALKLREPAPPEPSILQVMEFDECCSPRFSKQARTGALDKAETWTCPKCGVEYRPTLVDGTVRHWVAHIYVELVRGQ
jgi:hypothetical protein